jgi:transposase
MENGFIIDGEERRELMKPISDDLRTRIVNVYEETELSYSKVAARFQVSESSVRRFVKQWREKGTVTPQPPGGGHPSRLDEAGVALVTELTTTQVDATQDEVRDMVAEQTGIHVSQPTICRILQRTNVTRKKNDTGRRA